MQRVLRVVRGHRARAQPHRRGGGVKAQPEGFRRLAGQPEEGVHIGVAVAQALLDGGAVEATQAVCPVQRRPQPVEGVATRPHRRLAEVGVGVEEGGRVGRGEGVHGARGQPER